MPAKTVHVYPYKGAWAVKKEGKPVRTFSTRRKAVDAAKQTLKRERVGQFVVHGTKGEIRDYGVHGMTRVQDPPKKSRIAGLISRAVGQMALERVQSASSPPREHSRKN